MTRISRKNTAMQLENAILPEKIYHTAAYLRLSVEDNNRSGDTESITMQRHIIEKYMEQQSDMVLTNVYCDNGQTGTDF